MGLPFYVWGTVMNLGKLGFAPLVVAVLGLSGTGFANSVSFDFAGSKSGVSAQGNALFAFSAGELDLTVTNTTLNPSEITQAIQGLSWTYSTPVSGSYTFGATVTPVTFASDGTPTLGVARPLDQSGDGWSSTLTSILSSNKDLIIDLPISTSPNGSLVNGGGPVTVVSSVTFVFLSSAFTSNLSVSAATMRWGTGSTAEISSAGTPVPVPGPVPAPLPASMQGGLVLLALFGAVRAWGTQRRTRHSA
jgi:hypothetical protein